MKQTPIYPKTMKHKVSLFYTFFKKNRSWLDGLYEKSYTMKMGRIKMPGIDLHIINQAELVHRIMVDEVKLFPKLERFKKFLQPLLGNSILTSHSPQWDSERKMVSPSFENARISKVFGLMNDAVNDLMMYLHNHKNGSVINVDDEMSFITSDIIFRTIMSETFNREDSKKIVHAFMIFQEETSKVSMKSFFYIPLWASYFSEKRRKKSAFEIREFLAKIIQPRYDEVTNNQVSEKKDILSIMLREVDGSTGDRFKFDEVLNQVATLFLAGHETSASSLTWTLYLLSISQEEQEKAYQEVIAISKGESFTALSLKKMKYLNNIFKESLRLYPPVAFFLRESAVDTTLRDKNIKKGDTIVISPWLIQRNENYWKEPHAFNPDRFTKPEEINRDVYFPFGMGERVCIGTGFAMQEAILILASILREYKLELESGFIPDIVGRLILRPLNGMNIIFTRRDKTTNSKEH